MDAHTTYISNERICSAGECVIVCGMQSMLNRRGYVHILNKEDARWASISSYM